jgi:hypothetical protein
MEARDTGKIAFDLSSLGEFMVIDQTYNKVELEVLTPVTEKNLIVGDDGRARYIVTLKAIPQDKVSALVERFAGKTEATYEDTNGLFLTMNIWVNDGIQPALPMKGEKILCAIGYVPNRERTAEVLRVIDHKLKPAQAAPRFDLGSIGLVKSAEIAGAAVESKVAPQANELVH